MAAQNVQSRCMPCDNRGFRSTRWKPVILTLSGVICLTDDLARLDSPEEERVELKPLLANLNTCGRQKAGAQVLRLSTKENRA